MAKQSEPVPIKNLITVKFLYTLGLFTVIYIGVLVFALIFGLSQTSEYSALIVIAIAVGISTIDLALLLNDKLSPAMVALVLWVSPLYVLYRMFKQTELLNLDSTRLPMMIKQYTTQPIIRKANFG